jgi:hypothetical protein
LHPLASISAHQDLPATHLAHAFGHQCLGVQLLRHTLLRLCCTLLRLWHNFQRPCDKLFHALLLLGFMFHMCQELEDGEETLLRKVLLTLLASLQCPLGLAIISSWSLLRLFLLGYCCKSLGLLQDGIEVIQLRLLNNLKTIRWILNVLFTQTLPNNGLKVCVIGNNYWAFCLR